MVKKYMYLGMVLTLLVIGCKTKKAKMGETKIIVADKGYQLNYNLAMGGQRYQFIVDITKMHPERVFNYSLTTKRKKNGTITLSKEALTNATVFNNYFSSGIFKYKDTELTIWVSTKTFNEITSKQKIILNDGEAFGFKNIGKVEYEYLGKVMFNIELNGVPTEVETLHIKGLSGKKSEFWILNNSSNPLIIKMDLGWSIRLKEVNFVD